MADLVYTYIEPTSERHLAAAVKVLEGDGLIAYPTDVNWGIGFCATSSRAFERIRRLKPAHPKTRPFTLLCSSIAMMADYAVVDNAAYRLLKKLLPGPYTLLLQRSHNLPRLIKDKRKEVGVRVPKAPLLLDLIERYGKPIVNTSLEWERDGDAEIPVFGYEVDGHYGHALDLILDLGEGVVPRQTTIIDLASGSPEVVREGVGPTDFLGPLLSEAAR